MRRLGECIRDDVPIPATLPQYDDVMLWYNGIAIEVQAALKAIRWDRIIGDRPVEITSRPKTIDTLTQKLRRDHNTPLPSIQDVAGVRVEAEMNLDEQDAAASAIAAAFAGRRTEVHDLRHGNHSGYRAVHVWLWLEGGRAEVQVRTHLQGAWANTYEAAGDMLGRGIRYGELPDDPDARSIVIGLQKSSLERGMELEELRTDLDREMERAKQLKTDRTATTQKLRRLRRRYDRLEQRYQSDMRSLRDMFLVAAS